MRNYLTKRLFSLLPCLFIGQGLAASSEHELRQQLRADYAALLQARTEFEQSQKSGKASDGEAADFSAWISQLSEQVMKDCRALSIVSSEPVSADLPCDRLSARNPVPVEIDVAAETTEAEKTKLMVEQLNGSIGEFDERLLREQDRVKARAPRTDSATNAGGGTSGGESADAAGSASDETGEDGKTSQQDKRDSGAADKNDRTASEEKGTPAKSSTSTKGEIPDDIPDSSDDDVIARQIREAAEKETDPELKKKLWDEYRRYRDSVK